MSDKKTDARLFKDNAYAIAAYLSDAFEKNDHDVVFEGH